MTAELQLQHPIVLIHGLGARANFGPFEYFHGIPKILRQAGNEVYVANLTTFHTIEYRAKQLKAQLEERFPDGKVNLIGHSMGGLDARYLTSQLDFADRVASVTTIGTPHRGSRLSDIALGLVSDGALSTVNRVLAMLELDIGVLRQVTTRYTSEVFAVDAPDMPGVKYFSATSAISDPLRNALPLFWMPHRVLMQYEGDNDGFVSVESARWGEHICTYNGDHYGQIGQFLGRSRGLNHVDFFGEIVSRLEQEGF